MKMTGAQIIVKLLEMQGITQAAGIPGGSILPLYDELSRSSIHHILVRQEQAAGFIAQGMARSTGKPAVCFATSGPGAMNLLTAIADARSDSIPVIAITGQVNTSMICTDAFQEADTFGLSFPITKHSIMVKSPRELLAAIPEAFAIAVSGRSGPVLIDVPRDVQTAVCDVSAKDFSAGTSYVQPVRFRTQISDYPVLFRKFAAALLAAKKPVLYIGGGCSTPAAAGSIRQFLSIYMAPVVSSLMGIGIVPCTDERYAGMVGMHGSYAANKAMHDSDLVLAAGARFDDRAVGLVSAFCPHAKILHIDIDAAEVNKIYPADLAFVADVESILPVLTQTLKEAEQNDTKVSDSGAAGLRGSWCHKIADIRKKEFSVTEGAVSKSSMPNPRAFIAAVPSLAQKAGLAADDIIVTTDVGQHQMWTAQYYPFTRPRSFLTSGSLGTMGFGLPAAIGASLANPGRRVVCISGDGSIMMNIQELATLSELNLPVTVIVLQNGTLGMVRQQQKYLFNKNYSASEFIHRPDFLAIAEGFGIEAIEANNDSTWYEKAFTKEGPQPRFVLLCIDPEEDVLPYVEPGRQI